MSRDEIHPAMRGAAVASLALALAACGGSAPARAPSPSPAASTAAPARPAGCDQTLVVIGTVRGELENAPTDATYNQASKQLAALGKSLPQGTLRLDVDRANLDLTQYWLRLTSGEAGGKQARAFAADLARIGRECA